MNKQLLLLIKYRCTI